MDAEFTPPLLGDRGHPRHGLSWRIPCALLLACAVSLLIDVSVASFFVSPLRPDVLDRPPLRDVVEICEDFGHGFGATLIIIAVAALDPLKWRCVPWLLAGSLGAGMVANAIKFFLHRARPRDFDLMTGNVWNTFVRESNVGISMQSFPSSHTATAVGLAVMLGTLYPQGRWFFSMLAVLVGLQRIVSSAHFPSDVFAGAAVGWLVGMICANAARLGASPNKKR